MSSKSRKPDVRGKKKSPKKDSKKKREKSGDAPDSKGSTESTAAPTTSSGSASPGDSPAAAQGTSPPGNPPPDKKPRRRFRRLRITIWTLIAVALILRIVLAFSIAPLLDSVAHKYGFECRYDRLELSLLGGDLELWHLVVVDPAEPSELVHLEYCRADLSVLDLFRGQLVVRRVEADGVDLFLERKSDGTIPWLERLTAGRSEPAATTPEPTETDSSLAPRDLRTPIRLDALRLQHVIVHVKDEFVQPPLETRLHASVRLSNLGHPVHRPRFSIELSADQILEGMTIEGQADADAERVVADVDVDLRSLKLEPLRPYLAQAGFEPIEERWQGRFACRLDLRANREPEKPRVRAQLELSDASFGASGGDRWQLDTFSLDVELTRKEFLFHGGRVSGGKAVARRAPTGQVEVLGLRTIRPIRRSDAVVEADTGGDSSSSVAGSSVTDSSATSSSPTGAPPPATEKPKPIIPGPILRGFENFTCENLEAKIIDQVTQPESSFLFALDRLTFKSTGEETLVVDGKFRAPGLVENGTMNGVARLAFPRSEIDIQVKTQGIDPAAARAQLSSAQLESILSEGLMQFSIRADLEVNQEQLTSNVSLRDFAFHDEQPWIGVDSLRLQGLEVDRETGGLHVEEIAITSPRLELRRDSEERLIALGIRWDPRPIRKPTPVGLPAEPPLAPEVDAQAPKVVLASRRPPLHVDRIRWTDTRIRYSDESLPSAKPLEISDLGIEIDDLFIAADPQPNDPRGRVRGWIALPGVAESIRMDGTLEPIAGGTRLVATLTGENINGDHLAPYLAELGLAETLEEGRLSAQLIAHFSQDGPSTMFGLRLERFELVDRDTVLVSCEQLSLPEVRIEDNRIEVERLEIIAPQIRLTRLDDGNWQALGIRSLSQKLDPEKTAEVLDQPAPTPPAVETLPVVAFGGLEVRDAKITFVDQAHEKTWEARAEAQMSRLIWGTDLAHTDWSVQASVDGAAQSIEASGQMHLNHSQVDMAVKLKARGLEHALANSLLPPTLRVEWTNGEFDAEASFSIRPHPAEGQPTTGRQIAVSLRDIRFADGAESHFELARAEAIVRRLDWSQRVIEIESLAADGIASRAHRDTEGVLRAFGVAVVPAAVASEPAGSTPSARGSTKPTAAPVSVGVRRRALWETSPTVVIDSVEFGLERLEWFDALTMAEPTQLIDVTLRNETPWFALAPDQDESPPLRMKLTGRIEPKIAEFESTMAFGLFSTPLFIEVESKLEHFDGSQFDRVFAPLSTQLSLAELRDGRLSGKMQATVHLTRTSPLEFDFSRPFVVDLEVNQVALTNPNEKPWGGVDAIRVTGARFDLPKQITVREIEIERPHGRIDRRADGTLALGLFLPVRESNPAESEPSASSAAIPSASQANPAASQKSSSAQSPLTPRFTLERAIVSGLDLEILDHSTEHTANLPFDGFELTVENVTLPPLVLGDNEPAKPVRFSLFLEAGEALAPGAIEKTPVLGALTVDGEMALGETLEGWVRTSVEGFDLAHLRGPAEGAGVTLRQGVFDFSSTLHFRPSGRLDADSKISFLDLSLSEGPNGPIRRFLNLPAPLDVAIFVLRDAGGAIRLPVGFELDPNNISVVEIAKATGYALGVVISTAIANSPLRVGGTLTDLVGLTGEENLEDPEPPVDLPFAPGELVPNRSIETQLVALADRILGEPTLRLVLEHELSLEDIEVAQRRANPPKQLSRQLMAQLENRRTELRGRRKAQAQVAASSLLAGVWQEAEQAREALQTTDNELGLIEISLDQLYELVAPGSAHRARQREREAALAMARARLQTVRQQLIRSGVSAERIRVRAPRFEKPTAEPTDEHSEAGPGRVRVTPYR